MKLVLGQIVTNVITLSSIVELTSFFLFLVQAYVTSLHSLTLFGTLSRFILWASLQISIVKRRRTFILRNLILAYSWSSRCLGTTVILNASKYSIP